MPSVAVIVPVYREWLEPEEECAVRHLRRYLARYDCYQLSPRGLALRLEGLRPRLYEESWFRSTASYSKLCLSRMFYEDFADYDYMLIYQLDCLVFRDELSEWCERGYDYLGAPLFQAKDDPRAGFSGGCNGGLSLRKVRSFLAVLNSRRYLDERGSFVADLVRQPFPEAHCLSWPARWRKRLQVARAVRQGVDKYAAAYTLNEDHFWSGRAAYFHPGFRVAPPEAALGFAFEACPSYCFERNGRRLPFGAHAWARYERAFWVRHLLPDRAGTPSLP
jgi:hypothetical protein